jgi:hypothetical protein
MLQGYCRKLWRSDIAQSGRLLGAFRIILRTGLKLRPSAYLALGATVRVLYPGNTIQFNMENAARMMPIPTSPHD